jgi:hypothetical protein
MKKIRKFRDAAQYNLQLLFTNDPKAPKKLRTVEKLQREIENRKIEAALRYPPPIETPKFIRQYFEPDLSNVRMRDLRKSGSGLKPVKHYRKHI